MALILFGPVRLHGPFKCQEHDVGEALLIHFDLDPRGLFKVSWGEVKFESRPMLPLVGS